MLAIGLFVYVRRLQGVMAGEWLIGGIEPKIFAYSAIFMALSALLGESYLGMVAWLGLAASFHALVGGWASMAMLLLLLWRRPRILMDLRRWLAAVPIYGLTSAFALTAVLTQIRSPVEETSFSPSYIYSFLRNPHHVNPLAWSLEEWLFLLLYLLAFAGSSWCVMGLRASKKPQEAKIHHNRTDFICFVLCGTGSARWVSVKACCIYDRR
ncbi:hypothetical protein [Leptothoe sp. PORK10 BA2]|uniref:hypothetical protein n=1 Tax=Leptothoe sp. PORK10 BA2 TaxID=3110254 RepID=UPI002B1F33A2|nr:hypothetical protein [Leptothoe sp. PORK10 BA2]MEA5465789.1 hypothetical protein [Leptothoe sp. PORK10 BA2]